MKIKDFKAQWMIEIKDSEIQRQLIWSEAFKEKLFESVLENRPTGAITIFHERGKDYKEIIDGKQRIYALEDFWKGNISYKGKYFHECDTERFWNYEILIQESSGSFKDKVNLFNKINTCLEPLKPFELLRAKYYGDFLNGLSEFTKSNKYIRDVLGINLRGNNEMIILEILNEKNLSIDDYLELNKNKDFNLFSKKPNSIFMFIYEVFKKHGKNFKNVNTLIELAKFYANNKSEFITNRDNIDKDIENLLNIKHLEGWDKTSEYERILDRYVIKKDPKRIFDKKTKEQLWNMQETKSKKVLCALCGQTIDKMDDAEVDHIKPWSKGGDSKIINAQLTHKNCNIKKSNN